MNMIKTDAVNWLLQFMFTNNTSDPMFPKRAYCMEITNGHQFSLKP